MDTEFTIKLVTATVASVGALLGSLQYLTTRQSARYQNSKTEMELLSQSIAAQEAETDLKKFLIDVRKERISFLVFGIPIPNADIQRVITYYRRAEGKVPTGDIAKAWQYRDPCTKPLSFQLRGSFKRQYIGTQAYAVFCILTTALGVLALVFKVDVKQAVALVCVSLVSFVFVAVTSQNLYTAARLAKLEKKHNLLEATDESA
jgi:hypothetical protein